MLQNLFHALLNNPINKKTETAQKTLRRSKTGGVEGRYDRSQRFNGVFLRLPLGKCELWG